MSKLTKELLVKGLEINFASVQDMIDFMAGKIGRQEVDRRFANRVIEEPSHKWETIINEDGSGVTFNLISGD